MKERPKGVKSFEVKSSGPVSFLHDCVKRILRVSDVQWLESVVNVARFIGLALFFGTLFWQCLFLLGRYGILALIAYCAIVILIRELHMYKEDMKREKQILN
jgi:hypothetical protein